MKKKEIIFFVILSVAFLSFSLVKPLSSLDELWNYSFSKNIADGLIPYKDFNLVQTPFLFFITSIFLKFIFNGLIMIRILSVVLIVLILITAYCILKKLIKNNYLNLFIILIISLLYISFFSLNYNYLVLLFALIVLNYELKEKENILKLNIKSDYLYGVIMGLAILTKQSTGLLLAIVYVGYKWLAIRNKNHLILAFKISLNRGLGVLTPVIIFFGYLLFTNSLNDFVNFCILGISEFTNKISYFKLFDKINKNVNIIILSILVPIVIIYSILYLILNCKFKDIESKNILKIFMFGIANFVVIYPISDDVHFVVGGFIFWILTIYIVYTHFYLKSQKLIKFLNKLCELLFYCILVTLIIASFYNFYKYIKNDNKSHNLNNYEGIILDDSMIIMQNLIGDFRKEVENSGSSVFFVDADAIFYDLVADKYNKYFDLLLKGNLGKNGTETVIEKIKSLEKGSIFIVLNEEQQLNWQVPEEVVEYIRDNYNKVNNIAFFDVYMK